MLFPFFLTGCPVGFFKIVELTEVCAVFAFFLYLQKSLTRFFHAVASLNV